jgi:hypothetical protein
MTTPEALRQVEELLRDRLGPNQIPYAVGCVEDVRKVVMAPGKNPAEEARWVIAKRETPSRAPYTDDELIVLRVEKGPRFFGGRLGDAVVIWTLLDMIEAQKGWK